MTGKRDAPELVVCEKAGKTNECGECAHAVKHTCNPMWDAYKPHCVLSHGMLDRGTGPKCIPVKEEGGEHGN